MSDINENSGTPEQNQEHAYDNASNQNTNQYSGSEGGSTYWESNEMQNSFEVNAQQPNNNNSEYYQNLQDSNYNDYNNNQYELQQKKKSKKKPIIATVIIVILLMATAATAYAFSDTVRNSIDLLLKSPRDYYAHIENKSVGSSVDKSITYSKMNKKDGHSTMDVSATLSYDKDTVGAMLQSFLGMTISDIEALIGIPLNSIGFDGILATDENGMYQNLKLNLNAVDIISLDLFLDYTGNEMLLHFPELSPAYLKQSLDIGDEYASEDFNFDEFSEVFKKYTADSTGDFIKRYVKLITDEVEDVKLTKKEKLVVGDLTVESNLLTVYFYPETLKNITTRVLEEAKNDELILDLLPSFDITKEEFISKVDDAINNAKETFDNLPQDDEIIIMKVYVGKDGSILGRTMEFINSLEDTRTLGLSYIEDNNKGAYELYLDNNDGESIFNVAGSHTIENKAYTGSASFEMVSEETGSVEFEIEYEDIKTEIKNKNMYIYGNIGLSSYDMMGMEVVLEFDVKDDAQLMAIKLNLGKSSLVTLETSSKYLEDFTIPKPDENAQIFDASTDSDGYASTINIQEFISSLSDRLGVDLEGLLGSFLPIF
ncbi:MAG: hypothetical protein EWM47_01120 [Anaerolineaceae bacterium]|nr:MAG: hypothetical protein EWM47_01120 [Anaerolineaceae bacterium]